MKNPPDLPRPKAICLDLDNTLYEYAPCDSAGMAAVYKKLKRQFSVEEATAKSCFQQARSEIKHQLGATAASHSRLLYFQRMLEIAGFKCQIPLCLDLEQTFWRFYLQQMRLFSGVADFLYALREKNIAIAIVSDFTLQIQMRKLMWLELDCLVDYLVTSEEAGADKPDAAIFQLALAKLGTDPGHTWMIGDEYEKDIRGATACGMIGILKGHAGSGPQFQNFSQLLPYLHY